MHLKKACLREIHLDLIAPFQTSFGALTTGASSSSKLTWMASPAGAKSYAGEEPFYSSKRSRPPGTSSRFHLADAEGQGIQRRSRNLRSARARPRPQHGQSRHRIRHLGRRGQAKRNTPLWKLLGGTRPEIPCGVSIGIKPSIEELLAKVENELAAGYQRIKIKIKPGRDIDPVQALRQRFPRIRLMVDANSAYRLEDAPHLKATRPLLPHDDRAAARLGRHPRPRRASAPARNAHLPRRMHPYRASTRAPPSHSAPAESSTSSWAASAATRPRAAFTTSARQNGNSRLVRRHARIRHRPRPQYRPLDPAEFHSSRRRLRQPPLLDRRHHRPRSQSHSARHHQGANDAPASATSRA